MTFKKLAIACAIAGMSAAAQADTLVFNYSGAVNSITIPDAYADLYSIWYESADFDDFFGTIIVENYENYTSGTHVLNIAAADSPLKLSLVSGLLTGIEGTRNRTSGTFSPDDSQVGSSGALTIVDGVVSSFVWNATGVDSAALTAFNTRTLGSFPVKIYSIDIAVTGSSPNVVFDGGVFAQNVRGTASVVMVPEPETYAMLLSGLGLIGLAARRRMKSAS